MGHKYEIHEVVSRLAGGGDSKTVEVFYSESVGKAESAIASKVREGDMRSLEKVYDGFYRAVFNDEQTNHVYTVAWYVSKVY